MNESEFEKEFSKLEKAVENVLVENKLEAVLYFTKIYKHWDIIVGESLALKTVPSKLINKTLYVTVEDAAYSHHLTYFEKNILDLIASPEICGDGIVKKIIFRVGSKSVLKFRKKQGKNPVDAPFSVDYQQYEEAQKTSEQITDRKIKSAFARYMSKSISNTPK